MIMVGTQANPNMQAICVVDKADTINNLCIYGTNKTKEISKIPIAKAATLHLLLRSPILKME